MNNPVEEITDIVHRLTQSPPKEQEATLYKYFTPNASFTHPFCRTGSFNNSRQLVYYIFRWYKVMSPKIELEVNGIGKYKVSTLREVILNGPFRKTAYDEKNLTLYVNISQVFSIWAIPTHRSAVTLTTVLKLEQNSSDKKYYIASQNDLYQTDQFIRFVFPWGGAHLVLAWQFIATLFCVLGALLFAPFTWGMQAWADRGKQGSMSEDLKESGRKAINGVQKDGEEAMRKVKSDARKAKEKGEKIKQENGF